MTILSLSAQTIMGTPSTPNTKQPVRRLCVIIDGCLPANHTLYDIASDQLRIPETEYDAKVRLFSDLSQLGESVCIKVSKEGIRFMSEGEAANGNVLKQTTGAPKIKNEGSSSKKERKGKKGSAIGR